MKPAPSFRLACLVALLGCGSHPGAGPPADGGPAAGTDAAIPHPANGDAAVSGPDTGALPDAAALPDVPFQRPDSPPYRPQAGSCGFAAPAFCETFEAGPSPGGRSGDLDPARWSVARSSPDPFPTVYGRAFAVMPSQIPPCRPGLTETVVLPDQDVLVCDLTATIPSRHLMTTNASQNYGVHSYRIRQPFDFAGRTGTIRLDVDLSGCPLFGFPAVSISQDPTPAPSWGPGEHGSGPRNGIEIVSPGSCSEHSTRTMLQINTFNDYVQRTTMGMESVRTQPGSLNHLEISLTQTRLEVWASDVSPDGVQFPNFRLVYQGDVALPFARGYVNLTNHNPATLKYWGGGSWITRWDNVGFDGPTITNWRESSVAEASGRLAGLPGCQLNGQCMWRAQVIAANPDNGSVCPPSAACTFTGESRNVGWVLPSSDGTPVGLEIPDLHPAGATRARLSWNAYYNFFGGMPPTSYGVRYRLNGGAWHDRPVTEVEANATRSDWGAGNLNQVVDVDPRELRDGTNTLEVTAIGVAGSYPPGLINVDLIMETGP